MMPSNSIVSVIITCFNQEHCVGIAIQSVLKQTHSRLECIVVDDGSTDRSAKVIQDIASRDPRVIPVFQSNSGVASARNMGFSKSRGNFIQFLDGDDTLEPSKLDHQIRHLDMNADIAVSYSNHRHYFVERDQYQTFTFAALPRYPLRDILYGWDSGVSVPIHALFYRRSIWAADELPYPLDYHERWEDWVFLVLVATKGVSFEYLDEVLCTYFVYGNTITCDPTKSCVAVIRAAQYLESRIPVDLRNGFVVNVIERAINRFHKQLKPEILQSSWNWRIGYTLTRPFFLLAKILGLR